MSSRSVSKPAIVMRRDKLGLEWEPIRSLKWEAGFPRVQSVEELAELVARLSQPEQERFWQWWYGELGAKQPKRAVSQTGILRAKGTFEKMS